MTARFPRLLAAAMLLGFFAAAASAAPPKVKDEAKLFNDETVREANALMATIDKEYKREVVVETFKAPPAARKAEWDKNKRDSTFVRRFFRDWADERFRANGVNGVYVLMYRESPRGYQVVVHSGEKTKQKDFTDQDAHDAEAAMAESMRRENDNKALLDGLKFVQTQMEANQRKVAAPPIAKPSQTIVGRANAPEHREGSGIMGWLCPLLGALLVGWVVIALIRAFTGAGRPQQPGYGPGPGQGYAGGYGAPGYGAPGYGGGGFMSNMLGGLFGAVAGNWMYDSFFRGSHSPGGHFGGGAYGSEPAERRFDPIGGDDAGRPSTGGDGGVGGDFGDVSQGADFGDAGGDYGGGDFGGGDAGGDYGGGDFGGGDFGGGDVGGGDY